MNELQKRFENGLYGVAIGDAFGVPFQFNERGYKIRKIELLDNLKRQAIHMGIPGGFGTWSDDTAMTLATIDAFSELNGFQNIQKHYKILTDKFLDWLYNGKYTQDGVSWDVGITTMEALKKYDKNVEFSLQGCTDKKSSGNGSLMRFLPIPYILYKKYGFEIIKSNPVIVRKISAITHASSLSVVGCLVYTKLMILILNGIKKENLITELKPHLSFCELQFCDNIMSIAKKKEDEIKSSGFIKDSLEAALWTFMTTDNFDDCIYKALLLGDDVDTIASIAGGIAGSYYKTINKEWLSKLRKNEILFKYRDKGLELLSSN